jgi:hypothetical protein
MVRVSILAIVLLTGWCSSQAPTTDVDKAAAQFFKRLNAAQYDLIYNDAAEQFKSQNSKASVQDDLVQVMGRGRVQSWTRVSMTFTKEKNAQVALPVYTIRQDQSASELTLKFIDVDSEWKLLGFALRPHGPAQ